MPAIHQPYAARAWHGHRAGRGAIAWAGAALPSLWRGRSLRWQVLATFILINLIAALATASLVLFNAKRATEAEIAASVAMAERFVRTSIDSLDRAMPGGLWLEDLPGRIGPMRHVRLLISTVGGKAIWQEHSSGGGARPHEAAAPRWFASMVHVDDLSREIPVISGGRRLGTVLVTGEPEDEIAEVWSDMADLAAVGLLVDLSVILVLYFAFGRVLTPLSALSAGLRQLEQGHFRHRLLEPKARELADLACRFNALAGSLGTAQAENIRLNHRLLTAQEDERRLIAHELHDELGPCLFGLRANMAVLNRLASDLPEEKAGRVRSRVQILSEIAGRVQTVNRRLLQRLRPIALGDVPLADLLAALVSEFEKHDDAPDIAFRPVQLADSYGDCVDLTLYRCLQEGLTNIVRHAQAKSVELRIEDGLGAVRLSLRDDGLGMAAGTPLGMGLSGMKERVHALGGSVSISAWATGGTCLEITLPAENPESRRSAIAGHEGTS
ncbi:MULTISPECIES: ATP-binding protein [Rhodomicrobium]|uniref:ATP-binding protein n=1 Tax=Rhodomicrobium TaxID=1068 RepID=UPI0014836A05|nr:MULTISPECIES: ATP-binding protein [Rhodomicrobium]